MVSTYVREAKPTPVYQWMVWKCAIENTHRVPSVSWQLTTVDCGQKKKANITRGAANGRREMAGRGARIIIDCIAAS